MSRVCGGGSSLKVAPTLVLYSLGIAAQVHTPGPQVATFLSGIDDSEQPYGLYLPREFDATKRYPLVISLHGAESNHRLNLRRVFGQGNRPGETDAEASRRFPPFRDVEYIVASPLARGTMGYQGIAERDVYDVLAEVKRRFPIDEDRIYLTGLSMGGGGSLWLGLTRPDIWAAIAAVCPAPPNGTEMYVQNALNVPIKIFQGAIDPLVKAEGVREWQKRFVAAGVRSEYVEYPGVRHNAWDNAYKDGAVFDWFAQYRRMRYPGRVRFATREYKYSSAYWVRFDVLTPGSEASIDARFESRNKLQAETKGLDAFTVTLKGHPMLARSLPVSIVVDGSTLRARAADKISFTRAAGKWSLKASSPGPSDKRPGVEGPVSEAVAARHVYVYGTAGSPQPDELIRRREQAAQAAEWSTSRSRLLLKFRVRADAEVKASDMQDSNLVLFGNRDTNSLIAQLAPQLPLALNPGAADYGLVYVFPIGNRSVVICSGLPWWTRNDQITRSGFSFAAPSVRALETLGDYVLFKGGIDNVVSGGRFDRHWKLSPEAAVPLTATGAVEVRR